MSNVIKIMFFGMYKIKTGWLVIATLPPTFTFLVGILPSKSIEYGKIPTKKVKVGFRVAMAFNCGKCNSSLRNLKLSPTAVQ